LNVFRVVNNQMFSDLSSYRLLWRLERNGELVLDGEVPTGEFAATPPGGHTILQLEDIQLEALRLEDVQQLRGEGEYTLLFSFVHSSDSLWAKAGYKQAFSQIVFAPPGIESSVKSIPSDFSLDAQRKDENLVVTGNGFVYSFEQGELSSILVDGRELLLKPVIPNLWRAPIDNDFGYGNFYAPAKKFMTAVKWMKAGAQQTPHYWHTRDVQDGIEVVSEWKHPLCRKLNIVFTVYADGTLDIELTMQPKRIDAMRAGLQFVLPQDFENITWYGRGPHECYPDRKTGSRISKFSAPIGGIEHRYVRPQENGARCDVRWLSVFSNKRVLTFKDLSGEGLIFSAWHYEQKDLAAASHDHLLMRKPLTTLNLDGVMCGVGGDLPGVASLHEEYRLPGNREYRLRVELEFSLPG